jgi:hypothetical protein
MRRRLLWLLLAAILLAAFLREGVRPGSAPDPGAASGGLWEDILPVHFPLLLPLLLTLGLVLVLFLFSVDYSWPRPPSGDLEYLLERKQRMVRGSGARARRCASAGPPAETGPSAPPPAADVLGQLVQRKRLGAWSWHTHAGAKEHPR